MLGYQNTARNQASGPNAMLLHLPTTNMSAQHFLPVGRDGDVLDRMLDAIAPASASKLVRYHERAGFTRGETFTVGSWPGQLLTRCV